MQPLWHRSLPETTDGSSDITIEPRWLESKVFPISKRVCPSGMSTARYHVLQAWRWSQCERQGTWHKALGAWALRLSRVNYQCCVGAGCLVGTRSKPFVTRQLQNEGIVHRHASNAVRRSPKTRNLVRDHTKRLTLERPKIICHQDRV